MSFAIQIKPKNPILSMEWDTIEYFDELKEVPCVRRRFLLGKKYNDTKFIPRNHEELLELWDKILNIANKPDKPIAASELATRIAAELQVAKQAGKKRLVLVKGDQKVNYGAVVTAMVILQRAGADKVGLMTQTPERKA